MSCLRPLCKALKCEIEARRINARHGLDKLHAVFPAVLGFGYVLIFDQHWRLGYANNAGCFCLRLFAFVKAFQAEFSLLITQTGFSVSVSTGR